MAAYKELEKSMLISVKLCIPHNNITWYTHLLIKCPQCQNTQMPHYVHNYLNSSVKSFNLNSDFAVIQHTTQTTTVICSNFMNNFSSENYSMWFIVWTYFRDS